jgi:hypothetical protein
MEALVEETSLWFLSRTFSLPSFPTWVNQVNFITPNSKLYRNIHKNNTTVKKRGKMVYEQKDIIYMCVPK